MPHLLFATHSRHKLVEVRQILSDAPYTLESLDELSGNIARLEADESAMTFEGNAIVKAVTFGHATELMTVAEDSGLVVDALGGRPGVHSARWVQGSDLDRCNALLAELEKVPDPQRTARFIAVVALFDPTTGRVRTCQGVSEGVIEHAVVGTNGFGYDPVFRYQDTGLTGGSMTFAQKCTVGHRFRAWRSMHDIIVQNAHAVRE